MPPVPYYKVGRGPNGLENGLTETVLSPSDTNDTTNLITPGMPLLAPAINTQAASRPAADAVPNRIAIERQERPNQPVGVRVIGNAKAGFPPAGHYVEEIEYSGSVPAGESQVLADGAGKWKLVLTTAGTGIGRVITASGGKALVQF
jgi:hypothetical protein